MKALAYAKDREQVASAGLDKVSPLIHSRGDLTKGEDGSHEKSFR